MGERPIRVQLRRTKGWRMPENTVKVTRPGLFGNPFSVHPQHTFDGNIADERALHARFASCRRNREWFVRRGALAKWINDGCPPPTESA